MTLHRHPLVRLFAIKIAVGVVAVAAIVGGLFALNPGGLRNLVVANPTLALTLVLVLSASALAFAAVAIGVAIMMSRGR